MKSSEKKYMKHINIFLKKKKRGKKAQERYQNLAEEEKKASLSS